MYAPENTLPSIEQAVALGVDAIEIDVQLSGDGVAMVFHDSSLQRTTSGRGRIGDMSCSELQCLDAGARFSPDGGKSHPYANLSITIPTLAEVLYAFPTTPFVIELKSATVQGPALRVVRDLRAENRVVLASFLQAALLQPRREGLMTGASRAELFSIFSRSALGLRQDRFAFNAVFLPRRYHGVPISAGPVLGAAGKHSIPVHTWVENDPDKALVLWQAGVSGVVTDDPASLLERKSKSGK